MRKSVSRIMVALLWFPGIALAHTGIGETSGLMHGLAHPILGVDHLLAMIAVGLWAAQMGGRATGLVPVAFVGAMILGGILGFFGLSMPFIEEGILLSVLVLGILIAAALRFSPLYGASIVGIFALFHGYAHGTEMPSAMGVVSYTAGFALATALLHLAGIALGVLFRKADTQLANRVAGGAIVMAGVYLSLS